MRSRPYRLRGKPRCQHVDGPNLVDRVGGHADGAHLSRPDTGPAHVTDSVAESGPLGAGHGTDAVHESTRSGADPYTSGRRS